MPPRIDPFVHLPHLRAQLVEPSGSFFRNIDLEKLDREMAEAGVPANWRRPDELREAMRREALEGRMADDLWVFAYGSLMWDPAIYFSEVRSATIAGYSRRFCLETVIGRGTPERPGLMAGLDAGDGCEGLALRIEKSRLEEETEIVWRREMLITAYVPVFLPAETPQGPIEALAFVVDRSGEHYAPDLSFEETAQRLATGAGVLGTSLAYLENVADRCEALGIEDAELLGLRDRAREIAEETAA